MNIGFIIFVIVVKLFTVFIINKLLFNILYELQKELQKEDLNK